MAVMPSGVDYRTSLTGLMLMGAITGLQFGAAQTVALPRSTSTSSRIRPSGDRVGTSAWAELRRIRGSIDPVGLFQAWHEIPPVSARRVVVPAS
jgi:hypothetical protein